MKNNAPGPWKTKKATRDARDPAFWHADILNASGTIRVAIASGIGKEETEANARLIERAPLLLSGAEKALALLVNMDRACDYYLSTPDRGRRLAAISALGQAIAKAKGE